MTGVSVPGPSGHWIFAELRAAHAWARERFDERALLLCAALLAVLALHAAAAAVGRSRRDASNAAAGSDVLAKLRARTERRHAEAAAADPALAAAAAAAAAAARKARVLKVLLVLGVAGSALTLAAPAADPGALGGARRLAADAHLVLDGAAWARGLEGARRRSELVEGGARFCRSLLGWPPPLAAGGSSEGGDGGEEGGAGSAGEANAGPSPLAAVDHYEALGLSASDAPGAGDVRRAYRRRALFYHPDKQKQEAQRRQSADPGGPGPAASAEEQGAQRRGMQAEFLRLTEAYEVLSDPPRRARYDGELAALAALGAEEAAFRRERARRQRQEFYGGMGTGADEAAAAARAAAAAGSWRLWLRRGWGCDHPWGAGAATWGEWAAGVSGAAWRAAGDAVLGGGGGGEGGGEAGMCGMLAARMEALRQRGMRDAAFLHSEAYGTEFGQLSALLRACAQNEMMRDAHYRHGGGRADGLLGWAAGAAARLLAWLFVLVMLCEHVAPAAWRLASAPVRALVPRRGRETARAAQFDDKLNAARARMQRQLRQPGEGGEGGEGGGEEGGGGSKKAR